MSYKNMIKKTVDKWTIDEIKSALLTTDGIGLELKTKGLNELIRRLKFKKDAK